MGKGEPLFPLSMASPGERVRVVRAVSGERMLHRLAELGLTLGTEVQIVQNAGGPVLIAVRGSRLAIGRGMAFKLMVSPVGSHIPSTQEVSS